MVSKADIAQMASNLFDSYDKDNSGYLEPKEFKTVLTELFHEVKKNYPINEDRLNKMFTICDTDSDGKLTKKELGKAVEFFLDVGL